MPISNSIMLPCSQSMQAACHSRSCIEINWSALLPILLRPCHLLPSICCPSTCCCSSCTLCRPCTDCLSLPVPWECHVFLWAISPRLTHLQPHAAACTCRMPHNSCARSETVHGAGMEGQELFGTSSSARMCPCCRPTSWRTALSSAMPADQSSTVTSSMPYIPRSHLCRACALSACTQQQHCCHNALHGEKFRVCSSLAGNDGSAMY
jgi:hypothetical protein